MAFRKTLAHRFYNLSSVSSAESQTVAPPSSGVVVRRGGPSLLHKLHSTSGEDRSRRPFLRFLQRRAVFQSTISPDRLSLPIGDQLMERIRGLSQDRVRLEGLAPPRPSSRSAAEGRVTVEEARKVLRASQMEAARARLRRIPSSCISYSEFADICGDASSTGGGFDQGRGLARALDESGSVIVLGDVVFLRPELIVGAIESMMRPSIANADDPRREEMLREMEERKAEIDGQAEAQVKRELWCGLGFMVLQTAAFMRLTFWELSWDVMEPVCYFVTSINFMAGYAFYLRTSRDPSFEGFFESRLATKQRRLMKDHKFDLHKFNELRARTLPSIHKNMLGGSGPNLGLSLAEPESLTQ